MKAFVFAAVALFCAQVAWAGAVQIRFFRQLDDSRLLESDTRLLGDKTVVRIEGLNPKKSYILRTTMATLKSEITFRPDASGVFQTDRHAPVSGSYTKVDADGPFWSLNGDMGGMKFDSGIDFSVSADSTLVTQKNLKVSFLKSGISTTGFNVQSDGFRGVLYKPSSPGPKPLIIAWSGSEGGLQTGMVAAAALANAGYAALGLAYFGEEGLPKDLAQIPLEYFAKILERMKREPGIRSDQIAITGGSRGGELALLVGAMFPDVKAVIAMVPSPFLWGANVASQAPQAAWTINGVQLPFLNVVGGLEKVSLPSGEEAYSNRPAFEAGLRAVGPLSVLAQTRIELTNGPILLIGAEDDQVWPSADLARMAFARLRALGRNQDFIQNYPGAGHNLTVPFMPTTSTSLKHPQMGMSIFLGGSPEATAFAQRDAWVKTKKFLNQTFAFSPAVGCDERIMQKLKVD